MFCMDVPRTVLGFTHVENFKNVGTIEEDTSPSMEPGVCPGLYQDVLRAQQFSSSFASSIMMTMQNLHRFASKGVDNLSLYYK